MKEHELEAEDVILVYDDDNSLHDHWFKILIFWAPVTHALAQPISLLVHP